MNDDGTVISVDWFGAGRTLGGERRDFNLLESRTKLCVVRGGSRGDNRDGDGVPILVDTVLMDGQKRREDLDDDVDSDKDPFRFDLLPGGFGEFVPILLHGMGAVNCADWFTNMLRDLTSERMRVRRREGGRAKGPPRIFSSSSASADDVAISDEGGMVMETTTTQGIRYLSFC